MLILLVLGPHDKDGSKILQPVNGKFHIGTSKNSGKGSKLKTENCNSLVKVTEDLQYGKNIIVKTHIEPETNNLKCLPKCYKIDSNHQKLNTQEVSHGILKPMVNNQTGKSIIAQSTYLNNSTLMDSNTHQYLDVACKTLNSSLVVEKPQEKKERHLCDSNTFVASDKLDLKKLIESKDKSKVKMEESLNNVSKGNLTSTTDTEVKVCNKSENLTSCVKTDFQPILNSADVDFEANSGNKDEKPDFSDNGLIFSIKRDSCQTNVSGNSKQSHVTVQNNKKSLVTNIGNQLLINADM